MLCTLRESNPGLPTISIHICEAGTRSSELRALGTFQLAKLLLKKLFKI